MREYVLHVTLFILKNNVWSDMDVALTYFRFLKFVVMLLSVGMKNAEGYE